MPKVNLFKNAYEELPRVLRAKKVFYGIENADLATAAGVSERTMANRYHQPELFTVEQLVRLCKRLKFEVLINETGIHCRMERSVTG